MLVGYREIKVGYRLFGLGWVHWVIPSRLVVAKQDHPAGNASFEFHIGPIQITMGGKQAIQSVQDIAADMMVSSQSPTAHWRPVLAGIPPVSDANTDPGCSLIGNPLSRYDMP